MIDAENINFHAKIRLFDFNLISRKFDILIAYVKISNHYQWKIIAQSIVSQ